MKEEGVNFIGELYDEGIGYSGLNTAQSALSAIITLSNNISFGYHPSVPRFMKESMKLDQAYRNTKKCLAVRTVLDFLPHLLFKDSPLRT